MPSVLNDWIHELSYMQQSVLLAMVRNADGIGKHHPQKELIKWFRRCVLRSAFDGRQLTKPNEPGGGSFTGPVNNIYVALNEFIWARDEMTHHYFNHAMHAFQILGYKYPDVQHRVFWRDAYMRMVAACHLMPESEAQMDRRLCDNIEKWQEREDKCGGCTSTERKDLVQDLPGVSTPRLPEGSKPTHYGHVGPTGATFVKDAALFHSQVASDPAWDTGAWIPLIAESIEQARAILRDSVHISAVSGTGDDRNVDMGGFKALEL